MQKRGMRSSSDWKVGLSVFLVLIVLIVAGILVYNYGRSEKSFSEISFSPNESISSSLNESISSSSNETLSGSAVNGECKSEIYNCTAGASTNWTTNATNYLWQCIGENGGSNVSCGKEILFRLTVVKIGNGSGIVTSVPTGINCGTICSYDFVNGSSIILNFANNTGSTLLSLGPCNQPTSSINDSLNNSCNVLLDGNRTITSNFDLLPGYTDGDADGIVDLFDACNSTPSSLNSTVNKYGCPIPLAGKFDVKPDFTNVNLSNVSSFEIGIKDFGKISYPRLTFSLLRSNGTARYDLDSNINITEGKIFLNSSNLPMFNVSAKITMYDLYFNSPKILIDGEDCDDCEIISYDSDEGIIVFNVSHFTTYEAVDADPSVCGNNIIEVGEVCDGTSINSSCTLKGFSGGTIGCSYCKYNLSRCTSYSGGSIDINYTQNITNTNCTSDCVSGTKECSGTGFRICGNYDSDVCSEWSSAISCSSTEQCVSGSCVARRTNSSTLGTSDDSADVCDDACQKRKDLIWKVVLGIIILLIVAVIVFAVIFFLKKDKREQIVNNVNQNYQRPMGNQSF